MQPWWKDAIFYAIDVERFCDGNGDGVGDFKGLTGRLSYLAGLGVTCLWLLPFYPSSNRDNGYDITDYFRVDPRYGSFPDFLDFLHGAGEHSLRVIVDLVTQHTSAEHPWFQAARANEKSRYRDYYVWAPHPPPVKPGKGPMFPGEEETVWTYDESARAFYHHRFYHFEPGLNAFNPEVRAELKRAMDFWLSFGISGFRVDAASHMVEAPPVPGMRAPDDAHEPLRELYRHAKGLKADGLMLGEVDEPPPGLRPFLDGTQLDALFNFLLDNYLLLALATGRAEPVRRVFGMLPRQPERGQWVNFLRNLDEADLEQLAPEEREAVLRALAPEKDMRLFGRGMRRRLAPMLGADPRRLKLAFSLLFSLPGAPLFPYGDEIGMGEDLSRKGRNAVRLPMPWDEVERQRREPESLLSFVKRLCALRRQQPAIGAGAWRALDAANEAVLGHRFERLVLLHNLQGEPAAVATSLDESQGGRLETLLGESRPSLEKGTLRVELAAYGFAWLVQKS